MDVDAKMDAMKIDNVAKFIELKMSISTHHGVTTEAEFTDSLRKNGELKPPTDSSFNLFLQDDCCIDKWIAHGELNMDYPGITVGENDQKDENGDVVSGTQSYVTGMLKKINESTHLYRERVQKSSGSDDARYFNKSASVKNDVKYDVDPDAHKRPSFGKRKPDIVGYASNTRGNQDIVFLGDVKGRGCGDFSDAQIGNVLDFGTELMRGYQVGRRKLYVFLTDGYRFQFFSISRDENVEGRWDILQSSVFVELSGWQVSLLEYDEAHSL